MGILAFLIILAISGLIIGALARLALPGPDPMGIPATIGLGLGGSFLGGIVGYLLFGKRYGGSLLLAVAGSALIVWLMQRNQHKTVT